MSTFTVAKTFPRCTLICMLILVALWGIPPMQVHADKEAVSVWLTTPADPADPTNLTKLSNKLTQQPNVYLTQDSGSNPNTISVNENTTYQQVDGFGGTVTDSSAWLLRTKLSSSTRASVMANLFGSSGIGLNFLRQPFGATDFITSSAIGAQDLFYTFDDIPAGQTDYPLAHFSVGYDQNWMIPALQQAIQNNSSLRILYWAKTCCTRARARGPHVYPWGTHTPRSAVPAAGT